MRRLRDEERKKTIAEQRIDQLINIVEGTEFSEESKLHKGNLISKIAQAPRNEQGREDLVPALIAAAKANQPLIAEILIQQGANAEDPRVAAALLLILRKNFLTKIDEEEAINILLSLPGIDVNNIKDENGATALSLALSLSHSWRYGRADIINTMLAMPSLNLAAADENIRSALLIHSAREGNTTVFNTLLAMPGMDVNAVNREGKTLLIQSVMEGNTTLFNALLAMPETDINAVDREGKTALMYAAQRSNFDMVDALLSKPGININAEDYSGDRALEHAIKGGDIKTIIAFLLEPEVKVRRITMSRDHDISAALTASRSSGEGADAGVLWENSSLISLAVEGKALQEGDKSIPAEQEEDFVRAAKDMTFLSLAYSDRAMGSNPYFVQKLVRDIIAETDFPEKQIFLEVNEKIRQRKFTIPGQENKKFAIVLATVKDHSAYFLVEYDENNRPVTLSYIDANCPYGRTVEGGRYGFGRVTFRIDANKLSEEHLRSPRAFEQHLYLTFLECPPPGRVKKGRFGERLATIVTCNESGPIIENLSHPAPPQKVGKCTHKSLMLLYRIVMEILYPEMTFGTIIPEGPGARAHKQCKYATTEQSLNRLAGLVEREQKLKAEQGTSYTKPVFFDDAVRYLAVCLVHAVKKQKHLVWGYGKETEMHSERRHRIEAIMKTAFEQEQGSELLEGDKGIKLIFFSGGKKVMEELRDVMAVGEERKMRGNTATHGATPSSTEIIPISESPLQTQEETKMGNDR